MASGFPRPMVNPRVPSGILGPFTGKLVPKCDDVAGRLRVACSCGRCCCCFAFPLFFDQLLFSVAPPSSACTYLKSYIFNLLWIIGWIHKNNSQLVSPSYTSNTQSSALSIYLITHVPQFLSCWGGTNPHDGCLRRRPNTPRILTSGTWAQTLAA